MKFTAFSMVLVLLLLALVSGCSDDLVVPKTDLIPVPEYGATFNAAPVNLFLPFVDTTTLWYTVIGEPDSVKVCKDDVYYSCADTMFQATEPGSWEFKLEVSYTDTLITRELTITASELEIEDDAPLNGMMVISPNYMTASFYSTISIYVWGGALPYTNFEIIVDGVVYDGPTFTFHAEHAGEYLVVGSVTDADGNTVEFNGTIRAFVPNELPSLMLEVWGLAQSNIAHVGAYGSGGDGDYTYRWFFGSEQFATGRFAVYPDALPAGDHTFTCFLNDGTGNGSTFQDVTINIPSDIEQIAPMNVVPNLWPQDNYDTEVGVTVQGEAVITEGSGEFQIDWGYTGNANFSHEATFEYPGCHAGNHPFDLRVEDLITGQVFEWTGVIRVLPNPDVVIEQFENEIGLEVSRDNPEEMMVITTGVEGNFDLTFDVWFDEYAGHESPMWVAIHYSDDTWIFWEFPDMWPDDRPAHKTFNGGFAYVEPQIEVWLFHAEGSGDKAGLKCNGRLGWDRLEGDNNGLEKSSDSITVTPTTISPVWLTKRLGL